MKRKRKLIYGASAGAVIGLLAGIVTATRAPQASDPDEIAAEVEAALVAYQAGEITQGEFCDLACSAKALLCPTFPPQCERVKAAIAEAGCVCGDDDQ